MRYDKGHKETTHRRIVEAAAERFRKEGIGNVGVASLMSEIGLTQGGFYNHFASKEDLTREALAMGLESMRRRLRVASEKHGTARLEDLVDGYLSTQHRDHVGSSCMLTTLAIEAGREDGPVRAQLTGGMKEMIKLIGEILPPSLKPKQRETESMAVLAALVGSMILARATDDARMSNRLLEAGRHAALTAVDQAAP